MTKRQSKDGKYTFIAEVEEQDPDSGDPVHVELWKDNSTGGVFGIDSTFLEQVDHFYNPFNGEEESVSDYLPEP